MYDRMILADSAGYGNPQQNILFIRGILHGRE
jgi:hypothetical protein